MQVRVEFAFDLAWDEVCREEQIELIVWCK